jgi:hypothetical protein
MFLEFCGPSPWAGKHNSPTDDSDQSIEHDKLGRWSQKSHFPGHGEIMVPKLKQVLIFDLMAPHLSLFKLKFLLNDPVVTDFDFYERS